MPEDYMNIYKTARRAAGLTQEAAAEQRASVLRVSGPMRQDRESRPTMWWNRW